MQPFSPDPVEHGWGVGGARGAGGNNWICPHPDVRLLQHHLLKRPSFPDSNQGGASAFSPLFKPGFRRSELHTIITGRMLRSFGKGTAQGRSECFLLSRKFPLPLMPSTRQPLPCVLSSGSPFLDRHLNETTEGSTLSKTLRDLSSLSAPRCLLLAE